jgi:lipopolysaccharide assembly protein A
LKESLVQIIRTIVWILLVCGILIFSFYNWHPVEVTIWENLVLETKVPVLVVLAFLAGLLPLLAYHLSVKWRLKRRVRNLETSLKTLATSRRTDPEGGTFAPAAPLAPVADKKSGSGEFGFDTGDRSGDGGSD